MALYKDKDKESCAANLCSIQLTQLTIHKSILTSKSPRHCTLTIKTRGATDTAQWFDIWAAATAIDAICVRRPQPKSGIATGLGEACFLTEPHLLSLSGDKDC